MESKTFFLCDCCGFTLPSSHPDTCTRCGYPVVVAKEQAFLESSLHNLQRVVTYGGGNITVTQLVMRYRSRLNYLRQLGTKPGPEIVPVPPTPFVETAEYPTYGDPVKYVDPIRKEKSTAIPPPIVPVRPTPVVPVQVAPAPRPVQRQPPVPKRSFSFKAFLEEQTINIVALLGAFLILIGALSFVATTTNLLFSFLVLFIVHGVFGVTGVASYRLRGFRTVATIYTAIFALLVPLVGFSAYRVVSGNLVPLSPPMLITIAATYAALVYGALAIYQKFQVFCYFAVVSVIVASLALATAFGLSYWWWPCVLLLLAMPAILAQPQHSTGKVVLKGIISEPLHISMWFFVVVSNISIVGIFFYSLVWDLLGHPESELRFALFTATVLFLCWSTLFVLRTRRSNWLPRLPYLFLLSVLTRLYAQNSPPVVYVIAFTIIALFYYILTRFIPSLPSVRLHLEIITLALVSILPFIVLPLLPYYLFEKAYTSNFSYAFPVTWEFIVELVALLLGIALTISSMLNHIALSKTPVAAQKRWRWLLLLTSFLLNTAYGIIILLVHGEPVWWLLGFALFFVAIAVTTRSFNRPAWAASLDVLALLEIALMLLFDFNQSAESKLILWGCLAILSYSIVLYQRRVQGLFLPIVFALALLPLLVSRPHILFLASLILPLASAGVQRFLATKQEDQNNTSAISWVRPLLAMGLLYGIAFGILETLSYSFGRNFVSVMQNWLHIPFPFALELAAIAFFWYAAAVLGRVKWWLLAAIGFGLSALFVPGTSFWVLAGLVPISALLGLGISRLAGKLWALPFYIVAVFTAGVMGVVGPQQGLADATTWAFLIFAVLAYLISSIEWFLPGQWLAPVFVIWSVVYSYQLGDIARLPVIVLVCVLLGIGVSQLFRVLPAFSTITQEVRQLCVLPIYATALVTAVLSGLDGMFLKSGSPFFVALPFILLGYALLVYGFACYDRSYPVVFGMLAFAIWGIVLLPFASNTSFWELVSLAPISGLLGLGISRLAGKRWALPFYLVAVFAAVVMGIVGLYQGQMEVTTWVLLVFAVMAYLISSIEGFLPGLWLAPVFIVWSVVYSGQLGEVYRSPIVVLLCAALGIGIGCARFFIPALAEMRREQLWPYAFPLYTTAFLAAVLTGVYGTLFGVNIPFFAALPIALFLYALVAYGVVLFEQQPAWQGFSLVFVIWSTVLMPQAASCLNSISCRAQEQTVLVYLIAIVFSTAFVGLLSGGLLKRFQPVGVGANWLTVELRWNWSWYLAMVVAVLTTTLWSTTMFAGLARNLVIGALLLLILCTFLVTVLERIPELFFLSIALALWSIHLIEWAFWQQVIAYSLICALIFLGQFLWRVLVPRTHVFLPLYLYSSMAIVGQALVVLVAVERGGLYQTAGLLAQSGVGALFLLIVLIGCYGLLQSDKIVRHVSYYIAGLFLSLLVSWELSALGLTHLDWLTLSPAVYMTVVAPFLLRDEFLPRRLGQLCSILGAVLLLLPILWVSFSDSNLLPTIVLAGEALALLLLGVITRLRLFVLSGAALVVVGAMHSLFLPSLGLSSSLALTILGGVLLAIATILSLTRKMLQSLWVEWE